MEVLFLHGALTALADERWVGIHDRAVGALGEGDAGGAVVGDVGDVGGHAGEGEEGVGASWAPYRAWEGHVLAV